MAGRRNRDSERAGAGSGIIIAVIFGAIGVVIALAAGGIYYVLKDKPNEDRASANRSQDEVKDNRPAPPSQNPKGNPNPGPGVVGPKPVKPEPRPDPEEPPVVPPKPPVGAVGPKPGGGGSKLKPGVTESQPAGGAFARNDYRDLRADGSVLIGFDIGYGKVFNTTIISYLRPIWLTPKGEEELGTAYGRTDEKVITVKAKPGFAVGGIVIAGGGALEGFCLTFMKRGEKSLKANEAYTSDWYGEPTRQPQPDDMKAGDGEFVIGLFGKRFEDKGGKNFNDCGSICTIGFVLWVKE